jgi:ankyrin repeat protein
MTPLQHAVFSGNLPIVRFLLDHGADLHQEGSLGGHERCTALHTAAEKGIIKHKTNFTHIFFLLPGHVLASCSVFTILPSFSL